MSKTYDIPEEVQAVDRMTATIAKLEAQKADPLAALRGCERQIEVLVAWLREDTAPVVAVCARDNQAQARAAIERAS